jgi:hypothetical protein
VARFPQAVASLDEIPEAFRENYVKSERDGLFYPDVDVEAMPSTEGLRSTLQKYKGIDPDANRLAQRIAALEKRPEITAEEVERLREAATKGGKADVEALQKQFAAEKEAMQKESAAEKEKSQAETERERTAARRYYRRNVLMEALAKEGGNPKLILHELEPLIEVEIDPATGDFTHYVKAPKGDGRWVKDSAGNYGTEHDLVLRYKGDPEWGGAFNAPPITGSGAKPGASGAAKDNPWKTGNLTGQGRIMRENPERARALKAEAGAV